MNKCKLSPIALGLSIGVVWALGMFFVGILAYLVDYGKPFLMAMNSIYLVGGPSLVNAFLGALAGFVDGFIGGALIALFYNLFGGSHCHCTKKDDNTGISEKVDIE